MINTEAFQEKKNQPKNVCLGQVKLNQQNLPAKVHWL